MDSEVELYIIRAEDEFLLAQKDMEISTNSRIKEVLGIPKEKTFFYSVITHSYYALFYAAKAYLLTKGIKTRPPEEHKKTFEEFSKNRYLFIKPYAKISGKTVKFLGKYSLLQRNINPYVP